MPPRVEVVGITGVPEVRPGDPLARWLVEAAEAQGTPLRSGDVLVVTQKAVSKAEGRLIRLAEVTPSARARELARRTGRDPRLLEVVLQESRRIVRLAPDRGVIICETHHGFVCANAGVDASNVPEEGTVCLLPRDPDASARRIKAQVEALRPGLRVAVIVSDTFGRAWREGHVNFAVGAAGIAPLRDYRGTPDAHGRIMRATAIAVADELAAAAELVMGKRDQVPAALVRGYPYEAAPDATAAALLRDPARDLFR